MPIVDYVRKLTEVGTNAASVSNIRGVATPRVVLNSLKDTFFILDEIRHIFPIKPTFTKYTEMHEIYRRVTKISIPDKKRWEVLTYFSGLEGDQTVFILYRNNLTSSTVFNFFSNSHQTTYHQNSVRSSNSLYS